MIRGLINAVLLKIGLQRQITVGCIRVRAFECHGVIDQNCLGTVSQPISQRLSCANTMSVR